MRTVTTRRPKGGKRFVDASDSLGTALSQPAPEKQGRNHIPHIVEYRVNARSPGICRVYGGEKTRPQNGVDRFYKSQKFKQQAYESKAENHLARILLNTYAKRPFSTPEPVMQNRLITALLTCAFSAFSASASAVPVTVLQNGGNTLFISGTVAGGAGTPTATGSDAAPDAAPQPPSFYAGGFTLVYAPIPDLVIVAQSPDAAPAPSPDAAPTPTFGSGAGNFIGPVNIVAPTAVPEPSALLLVSLGLGALAALRGRRRQ